VLQKQLEVYDQVLEKKMGTPFVKEITESQKKFAARAVTWEQDVVVSRAMAYNHYFGKRAAGKKA
jgi:TRAP-type mannitol/chloroaromatic compound transport system substrate-binding protein